MKIDNSRIDEDDYHFYEKLTKRLIITDFIFSIFAIITLFFSYTQIKLACEWYIVLPIKKGVFSCFIPYLIFSILSDLIYFIFNNNYVHKNLHDFIMCVFFLLIGFISLGLSIIFKDITMAFTNGIVYIDLIFDYFSNAAKAKERLNVYEGIIIAGFTLASFILIGILVAIHKEKIFK